MSRPFFKLALFGLACEVLMAWAIMGQHLWQMFDLSLNAKFGVGMHVTVLTGIAATLGSAAWLDQRGIPPGRSLIPGSVLIFMAGTIAGSAANFLIQGVLVEALWGNRELYLGNAFYNWFVKPAYWLTLLGTPASLLVGTVFWGFWKIGLARKDQS
jgi:hypothetical protein